MIYKVSLLDVSSIHEIDGKWSHDDYIALLDVFEFGDPGDATDKDLKELLYMAISDFEPQEAAALILQHQLGEELNEGQIEQISHDMLKENVAEHYSDISFHSRLFDINELLFKAYNGKFPHAKASVIKVQLVPHHKTDIEVDEAIALKCLAPIINDHAVIKRLYKNQLAGEEEFDEAADIIWYFKALENDQYEIITSDYWINDADFTASEKEVKIELEE
jgi:predicted nucleic acid-binding protein